MRSPKFVVLLLCLLLCAANLVLTLNRSLIPLPLEGTVEDIEVRHEKHIGRDDVYLMTVGDRTIQVDAPVASAFRPGDRISKRPFSRTARASGVPVRLSPSRDFWRMAMVMPLILLIAVLLTLTKGGGT